MLYSLKAFHEQQLHCYRLKICSKPVKMQQNVAFPAKFFSFLWVSMHPSMPLHFDICA